MTLMIIYLLSFLFFSLFLFLSFFFFFFQAEDGIRDRDVTGVQTCALPISPTGGGLVTAAPERPLSFRVASCFTNLLLSAPTIGTKGLLEDWNWSTTVASMPDVHTPSNLMPELKNRKSVV